MDRKPAVSLLFVIAALWDGLLGVAFLVAASALYRWFDVTPPNHFGYVHFPAALLIVFGLMFAVIAKNPVANRNLIPFGMLLKVSFCGVVFYHWISAGLPNMWKPFAFVDLAFLVLFIWAYAALGRTTADERYARQGQLPVS
jgi:hypothetical protein